MLITIICKYEGAIATDLENIKMTGNIMNNFIPINQAAQIKRTTSLINQINKINARGNTKPE